jgi:hypothetical protein
MSSPTQRSLAYLRKHGYHVAIVEKWNPYVRIRQDLFGCIDLIAIKPGQTLAVQTTSGSHVSGRADKIRGLEALTWMQEAGWTVAVHGWAKRGARGKRKVWTLREERIDAVVERAQG